MGAVNAFNGETNKVWNRLTNTYETVSGTAKQYKADGISSIVVAEENYGEGSSREHAAMEPRFLHVKVILAKSFARIHETNLKKQGMLAVTFANRSSVPSSWCNITSRLRPGENSFNPTTEIKSCSRRWYGRTVCSTTYLQ